MCSDANSGGSNYFAQNRVMMTNVMAQGAGNDSLSRNYHMPRKKLESLHSRMLKFGRWLPPWRQGGGPYWSIIEALYELGPNRRHFFGDLYPKIQEVMERPEFIDKAGRTAWYRFCNKENRSSSTGYDAFDRILQNIRVNQRIGGKTPYGLKLAQVGSVVNVYGTKAEPYVELKIGIPAGDWISPINEARLRNYGRSVDAVPSGYLPANEADYIYDNFDDGTPFGIYSIDLHEIGEKSHLLNEPKTINEAVSIAESSSFSPKQKPDKSTHIES